VLQAPTPREWDGAAPVGGMELGSGTGLLGSRHQLADAKGRGKLEGRGIR
jgi:hypothetical protein